MFTMLTIAFVRWLDIHICCVHNVYLMVLVAGNKFTNRTFFHWNAARCFSCFVSSKFFFFSFFFWPNSKTGDKLSFSGNTYETCMQNNVFSFICVSVWSGMCSILSRLFSIFSCCSPCSTMQMGANAYS